MNHPVNKVSLSGGLAVLGIAIIFFVYSLEYPYESELGPGSGMLPRWLSGILIVLALTWIGAALRGKDSSEKWPEKKARFEIIFILGAMAGFVFFLPILGFNLTGSAFLFVFLRRNYRWFTSLAISVGATILLYLLFTQGFASPLPVNAFGF